MSSPTEDLRFALLPKPDSEDFNDPDKMHMRMAIQFAEMGRGAVEPNPLVGCVLVKDNQVIGFGHHELFGGPHAEVNAIRNATTDPAGATAYVTLEPCCHTGKTGPCTEALINARIARVVIAHLDPFAEVNGAGVETLRQAGIEVDVGVLEAQVAIQNAAFFHYVGRGQPWVIAKWAMTLDGKTATRTHDSKWISNERSRELVHQRRGQVDAIIVGSRTAEIDDPSLTARPPGPRIPLRVVLDSKGTLAMDSKLVQTSKEYPTMVVCSEQKSDPIKRNRLREHGVEVFETEADYGDRIEEVLAEFGKRGMNNVLLEGGANLLSEFLSANRIDEVNAFVAPRLIGDGVSAMEGFGFEKIQDGLELHDVSFVPLGNDLFYRGFTRKITSS